MKIKIKALSINRAFQGHRFKTPSYKAYEQELMYSLPNYIDYSGDKKITLTIQFGTSSILSDIDNIAKPFIDVLQKKYGFNDKMIYKLQIEKFIVPKGDEYIGFNIENYEAL